MSLARDFSEFADQVNVELDGLVNGLAEQSTKVEKIESEKNELLAGTFERLGAVMQKLEGLAKLEVDMATVKRLVTSIHDGHVGDMRDVRYRLGVLEAKAKNVTHPAEEITPPHPRSTLPR